MKDESGERQKENNTVWASVARKVKALIKVRRSEEQVDKYIIVPCSVLCHDAHAYCALYPHPRLSATSRCCTLPSKQLFQSSDEALTSPISETSETSGLTCHSQLLANLTKKIDSKLSEAILHNTFNLKSKAIPVTGRGGL
jgi:hypothetical protein